MGGEEDKEDKVSKMAPWFQGQILHKLEILEEEKLFGR